MLLFCIHDSLSLVTHYLISARRNTTLLQPVDPRQASSAAIVAALPTITDKDRAKIERRAQRDEDAQRAALAAHQARAEKAVQGSIPTIVRNT